MGDMRIPEMLKDFLSPGSGLRTPDNRRLIRSKGTLRWNGWLLLLVTPILVLIAIRDSQSAQWYEVLFGVAIVLAWLLVSVRMIRWGGG